MYKRMSLNSEELNSARTGGIEDACKRYGLGKTSMRCVAEEAHAVIRIGKRYLINYTKVDRYMDSLSQ